MSQSMLSLKRSTTSAVLQLNLYCGGPSLAAPNAPPTALCKGKVCACAEGEGGPLSSSCASCRRAQPLPSTAGARFQPSPPAPLDELDADEDSGSDMSATPLAATGARGFPHFSAPDEDEEGPAGNPSPPGTPESDEGFSEPDAGSASPVTDELYHRTLDAVTDYYQVFAGRAGSKGLVLLRGGGSWQHDKLLETLRRVGDGVMDKHKLAFQGMLRKLDIKRQEDLKCITTVAHNVFSDGVTNWGRIIMLICFGALVAKHLKTIQLENSISILAQTITDFLMVYNRTWIVQHNGWDGCIEFFHVEDVEGGIRNVLMAFAGVAGLGAGLAYLIR
ncbi:induced myeloid leukemia cell differentiation protein Mcl-1 [Microcaecilia unicolor]|uniref:Induced myeloid leukemia cell differentiation protein Mcl-1 n=1 Tax=Microcaecilia unicolor TaxID=1415580 RepID=A0A6P7WPY8_9AMPH|nr:induced myeloid leukemia cell differentiation protein Mcl-1 [Microcaecilia unicolor]